MPEEINIVNINGHYEVYIDGKFYCSTETVIEAVKEVENEQAARQ